MCHLDRTIYSTSKSVLSNALEKRVKSDIPSHIDCKIIDGMHIIRHIGEFPATFGKISEYVIKKVCNGKPTIVDLVFGNYVSPSIKMLRE